MAQHIGAALWHLVTARARPWPGSCFSSPSGRCPSACSDVGCGHSHSASRKGADISSLRVRSSIGDGLLLRTRLRRRSQQGGQERQGGAVWSCAQLHCSNKGDIGHFGYSLQRTHMLSGSMGKQEASLATKETQMNNFHASTKQSFSKMLVLHKLRERRDPGKSLWS